MSNLDKTETTLELIVEHLNELKTLQHKSNGLSQKLNLIKKKQHQQSLLDFEQSERQYLIEKSKLQPSFRLSVSETLSCEPDFVNDPEQASESSFLKAKGVEYDSRVLRLRLDVKGGTEYMHPSIVFLDPEFLEFSGLAHAMSEHVYFISLGDAGAKNNIEHLIVYFVYRDQTALPVVHKYKLKKESSSALQRWHVSKIDKVYAKTHNALMTLETAQECEQLFISRG
jgi:hypothetical protein